MTPRATVLVPTRDHGPTLLWSVRSALRQTVRDLEVLVVGDGASEAGARAAAELAAGDPRVRFLPFPKGPRHGEIHRHAALAEARGAAILYLSDDDLWLPDHAERLLAVLERADFASSGGVSIAVDGSLMVNPADLAHPWYRERALLLRLSIPLSYAGHTRAAYGRLPGGWTTTPDGVPTDSHMWARMLRIPGLRAATDPAPTVLQFSSLLRRDWTPERRCAELERWDAESRAPGWALAFESRVREAFRALAAAQEEQLKRIQESRSWVLRDRILGVARRLRGR